MVHPTASLRAGGALAALFSFSLLLAAAGPAAASLTEVYPTAPKSGIHIEVSSWFETIPTGAFAPVDITIKNDTGVAHEWTMETNSPSYYSSRDCHLYATANFAVEAHGRRTFRVLVPVRERIGYGAISVQIAGAGVVNGSSINLPMRGYSSMKLTRYLAASSSLATPVWKTLEEDLKRSGAELDGSDVRITDLPEDWRALSGVGVMYLRTEELAALSAPQRDALLDWVACGGQLLVFGARELPADLHATAMGKARPVPSPEIDVSASLAELQEEIRARTARTPAEYKKWEAYKAVGEVRPNAWLLSVCMIAFAVVIGPVNLFSFAGGGRRARLFWTTPLIAVGASGLLFVIILLQDGVGGHGVREAVVHLQPARKKAVVLQRQISRTGLLPNSSFTVREQALVTPLWAEELARGRSSNLRIAGSAFGGDWFRSRSLQAQSVRAVVPTRAEISVVAGGGGTSAPPVIISSIDGTLRELYYRDRQHRTWMATRVGTGVRTTMARTESLPSEVLVKSDDPFDYHPLGDGEFYATTLDQKFLIPTLASIRWDARPVTIVGPVTEVQP